MQLPADRRPPKQPQKDMVTGTYSHDYTGGPIKGLIHVSGDRGQHLGASRPAVGSKRQ